MIFLLKSGDTKVTSLTKKFLIVVIALIIVGGSYFLSNRGEKRASTMENSEGLSVVAPQNQTLEKEIDADQDGLPDWQEILLETDVNNPDTDGDGTKDGDEVAGSRDPRIKGPSDIIIKNEAAETAETSSTKKFSGKLLEEYIRLKQSGNVSPEAISEMMQNIVESGDVAVEAKKYLPSNFKPIAESTESVHGYGNAVGAMLTKSSAGGKADNEILVLYNALEKGDEKALEALKPISQLYATAVTDMLSMDVPSGALPFHINLVNSFSAMAVSVDSMSKMFDDPLLALAGVKKYQDTLPKLTENLKDLGTYFASRKAQFTANEPGYVVTQALGGI